MTAVGELELPAFDYLDPTLSGPRFHETMRELAAQSWLASMPLGFVALDREAGEFFLRSRVFTFPGMKIAEIFGIDDGPLWEEIRRNILHINGDDHRRLRGLVNPFFTPRAVERWRPTMRSTLADLFDDTGRADVVDALCKPYPSRVIATVMGAPLDDAGRLWDWSNWIQRQFGMKVLEERPQIERAVAEFYDWAAQLLARRRDDPGDDLISTLISARIEGETLDDDELINLVLNVLVGGVDTTQSQLAHALRLFAEHPDQWEQLRCNPELDAAGRGGGPALRADHAVHGADRARGRHLPRRDVPGGHGRARLRAHRQPRPRHVRAPGPFDITEDRGSPRPLTFGAGPHYCLGANLARAELQEALAFLAPRLTELTLDGDPEFGSIDGIYGLDALPIRWSPAATG